MLTINVTNGVFNLILGDKFETQTPSRKALEEQKVLHEVQDYTDRANSSTDI